jgi:hypothetical protein
MTSLIQAAIYLPEWFMQLRWFDGLQKVPYLSITRYPLHPKQALRAILPLLPLHVSLMRQKRGRLYVEHRECPQPSIGNPVLSIASGPMLRNFSQAPEQVIQHLL